MTPDRWPERAALVATQIPDGASVIDLGAGAGGLGQLVTGPYHPVDLPEFDMNRNRWPEGSYDVAVMAGVLEYARYPAAALRHLAELAPVAIVTYVHGGRRRDPSWVNDLSGDEFVLLAQKAGYRAEQVATWRYPNLRPQTVWRLSR